MYSKLLFLLVLPLAMRGLKCRYWIEQGLISGVFINVVLSTLYYFHVGFIVAHLGSHFAINMTFAINPLQMIFVVAFACWILLQRLLNKEAHWTDISLFIVLTLYLWLINIERSGYLLYLVMIILALYQVLHKKGFILGLLFIPILLIGLYEFSANVKTRIDIGIANIQAFEQAQTLQELQTTNSLGLRMAFFMQSLAVIKAHPLLGTGIGSFKYVYTKMGGPSAAGLTDTHNAYTMVAFELGLIGLFIYLAWLFSIFKVINKLAPLTAHRLRGLWWMFVVMGFTDSGLVLNAVGLSFIMGISLYAHEQLTG